MLQHKEIFRLSLFLAEIFILAIGLHTKQLKEFLDLETQIF